MKNVVAIVGRPNVGKSTLFNKLVGKRVSIVHDMPGVTRDRLYHEVSWLGDSFKIIDTGGIEVSDKPFQTQIQVQAEIAMKEAEVIIMVVDGITGLTPDDEFIASLLRRSNKKIFIAANKLEGNKDFDPSIWTLGFENILPISAIHGEGIGDLLDLVKQSLVFDELEDDTIPKLAIIGRPNAGKSSLLNSLSGEERSIVSEISGTTRDSVNSIIKINDKEFNVIDTAGINKKSKLIESVDHYALTRAISSLEDADITLLIIDSTRELAHFDARVAGYTADNNKPIIIVINKWDLVKKDTMTMKRYEEKIRKEFKFLAWSPIVFISAIKELRLNKLKDIIITVEENIRKKIKTTLLNEMIVDIQMMQPAPSCNGGRLSIAFLKQVDGNIPTFILFVNNTRYLHFSYERYLEKKFREYFGFEGTPLRLIFKSKRGDKNEKR
ncbi:MAG: ribosome biogenesis GTPase Der [Mycoplasmataceae bacterium]|nr:ribosome biogenesis GTPase Der [Mycoplasmataceae bacterium]